MVCDMCAVSDIVETIGFVNALCLSFDFARGEARRYGNLNGCCKAQTIKQHRFGDRNCFEQYQTTEVEHVEAILEAEASNNAQEMKFAKLLDLSQVKAPILKSSISVLNIGCVGN